MREVIHIPHKSLVVDYEGYHLISGEFDPACRRRYAIAEYLTPEHVARILAKPYERVDVAAGVITNEDCQCPLGAVGVSAYSDTAPGAEDIALGLYYGYMEAAGRTPAAYHSVEELIDLMADAAGEFINDWDDAKIDPAWLPIVFGRER